MMNTKPSQDTQNIIADLELARAAVRDAIRSLKNRRTNRAKNLRSQLAALDGMIDRVLTSPREAIASVGSTGTSSLMCDIGRQDFTDLLDRMDAIPKANPEEGDPAMCEFAAEVLLTLTQMLSSYAILFEAGDLVLQVSVLLKRAGATKLSLKAHEDSKALGRHVVFCISEFDEMLTQPAA